MSFERASTFERIEPGRYAGTLSEDWYQGRGVYGGLVSAIVLRAMEHELADASRSARTLALFLCAPAVAGEAQVHVRVERAGRYVTQLGARMLAQGELVATAIATFARPRASETSYAEAPMPGMPAPEEVRVGPDTLFIPEFCKHLELRQAIGGDPFGGAPRAHLGGYVRFREPATPDAPMIAALLDAWAPAVLCRASEWSPAATIDLSIHFMTALPLADAPTDAYYAFEARSHVARDGYADDHATLWTASGTPLAFARQIVALFR